MKQFLAIDIGASSGRHIVGHLENGEPVTREVYRFPNGAAEKDGGLYWDTEALFSHVVEGIRRAMAECGEITSLAIDTWGVDYVLLGGDRELAPCSSYRSHRTEAVIGKVHALVPFEELYAHTGIQFQPFNTVYQLYADKEAGLLERATDFLMMPEYLSWRLTGVKKKEYTNATTGGLVNAGTGAFDAEICGKLGYPARLFGELCPPGTPVGRLLPGIAEKAGGQTEVVLCASHDTASAVEGIPPEARDMPYLSSGTWSLFGVRAAKPVLTEESRRANYTNEGGAGYIRYLKNIMGLWLVQSLRAELCPGKDYGTIAEEARASAYEGLIDADDACFLSPESMKGAFDAYLAAHGQPAPRAESDYFRCAFASLAKSYAAALSELEKLTGKKYGGLCIVGGGAKNTFLNELTERACGVKVHAYPIEATALGNLKIQAKIQGE